VVRIDSDDRLFRILDTMDRYIDFDGQGTFLINKELRVLIGKDIGWAYNTTRLYINELIKLGHLGFKFEGTQKIVILSTTIDAIRQKLSEDQRIRASLREEEHNSIFDSCSRIECPGHRDHV